MSKNQPQQHRFILPYLIREKKRWVLSTIEMYTTNYSFNEKMNILQYDSDHCFEHKVKIREIENNKSVFTRAAFTSNNFFLCLSSFHFFLFNLVKKYFYVEQEM